MTFVFLLFAWSLYLFFFVSNVSCKSQHSVQRTSNQIVDLLISFRQSFAFLKASSHVMHPSTALATRASHHLHTTSHQGSSASSSSSSTNGYHDVFDVHLSPLTLFIVYSRLWSPPNQPHLPRLPWPLF